MLFIQRKWTSERKSGYELLKQWYLPLQRKNSNQARIWQICILHPPFIFFDRWGFNDEATYEKRRFENESTK